MRELPQRGKEKQWLLLVVHSDLTRPTQPTLTTNKRRINLVCVSIVLLGMDNGNGHYQKARIAEKEYNSARPCEMNSGQKQENQLGAE